MGRGLGWWFEKESDKGQMYTLYLDETGDWGYPNYAPEYPILCLCGCIVHEKYYAGDLVPTLKALKKEHFGKEEIVLHRYKVQGRKGEFCKLTETRRDTCMFHISQAFATLDIKLIIAALDKADHYKTYGVNKVDQWLPKDIYCMLFTFMVERFLAFLMEGKKSQGRIVAERRGRKEDNKIQLWYSRILEYGTQFYRNWQFQKALPTAVEFREKRDNVIGLQISDWIAQPMAKIIQYPDGSQDKFGEWGLYRDKIWIGKKAPFPGQVGFKTFPNNLGRKLLNMPLKSG